MPERDSADSSHERPHPAVYAWLVTVPFAAAVFFGQANLDPFGVVWAGIQLVVYTAVTAAVLMVLVTIVDPKLKELVSRV